MMTIGLLTCCWSIGRQYIVYDLPESVTTKVREYVDKNAAADGKNEFLVQLAKNEDETYSLLLLIMIFRDWIILS
jgi:hypothetical protein